VRAVALRIASISGRVRESYTACPDGAGSRNPGDGGFLSSILSVVRRDARVARFPRFLVPQRVVMHGFICGGGHCGTTLIANILASHPDAYVPLYETAIFQRTGFKIWRRHLKLLWTAALLGKRAFVEKSPAHLRKLEVIRAEVRGARFIIPVRDGRDVVASMFKRSGDLKQSIERWISANAIVLAHRGEPDVQIYRHEDLITDPPGVIRQVCEFLDLEYSERLLDYHKSKRLWFKQREIRNDAVPVAEGHDAYRNWQVNQPLFDNRGRWVSELSEKDISELTRGRGRRLMEAFGYL